MAASASTDDNLSAISSEELVVAMNSVFSRISINSDESASDENMPTSDQAAISSGGSVILRTSTRTNYQLETLPGTSSDDSIVAITSVIDELHLTTTSEESRPALCNIPNEVLDRVCSYLTNSGIKMLRLTCGHLGREALSELRIERVFISPIRKVLDVFYGIANNKELAARVKEIIWDDSMFQQYAKWTEGGRVRYFIDGRHYVVAGWSNHEDYSRDYEKIYGRLPLISWNFNNNSNIWGGAVYDHLLRSFTSHKTLLIEEASILRTREDSASLIFGVQRFPNLRAININESLWKSNLIDSPLSRLLPDWLYFPGRKSRGQTIDKFGNWDWAGGSVEREISWPIFHPRWHSVNAVMEELAKAGSGSHINKLTTSVGNGQSVKGSASHTSTMQVFGKLRELELRIDLKQRGHHFWDTGLFDNKILQTTLSRTQRLEHLRLEIFPIRQGTSHLTLQQVPADRALAGFVFRDAIPIGIAGSVWPLLRTLELVRISASHADLVDLFLNIRPTVKIILLKEVEIVQPSTYKDLLQCLRDKNFWLNKPKFSIELQVKLNQQRKTLIIDEDLVDFFEGGPNPFEHRHPDYHGVHSEMNILWLNVHWAGNPNNTIQDGFGVITPEVTQDEEFAAFEDDKPFRKWRGRSWEKWFTRHHEGCHCRQCLNRRCKELIKETQGEQVWGRAYQASTRGKVYV